MIKMKGVQKRFHEEIVNTSQMEFQLPNQLSPLKYVSTLTPKMIVSVISTCYKVYINNIY